MDQAKKKQIKKITTWVLLAALVAGLTAMPLLAKAEAEADGPVATVHSGTVEEGTVQTTLHGGGTLVTEGIEEINLPSGVKITEFLVKNGDAVTAGTPLAAVDKVSVMTAITSVAETMEYLQEEMKSAKTEKVSSTVAATAGGRIKKVYAGKGDSVQEVMLRDGALALLSLDGLMAVEIKKKLEVLPGDTVTVTLSDGRAVTGRIASNLDGVIVITLEDEGYAIGEQVTITGKDDSEIGEGELYVHNAWAASAFSGIIQTVTAKEETKVTAGTTLFTLTDTDFQGKLAYTSALHREYEELMQDLFRMYNSGTIDAPCDGTISGIDQDSPHLLAAENEEDRDANLLTAEEGNWKVVLLSAGGMDVPPEGSLCNPEAEGGCPEENLEMHIASCPRYCHNDTTCDGSDRHYPTCIGSCGHGATVDACSGTGDPYHHHKDCIKSCTNAKNGENCRSEKFHHLSCVNSCTSSDGTTVCPATGDHLKTCIRTCTHADPEDPKNTQCPGTLHHYPDCVALCITSDSGSKTCPASIHYGSCYFAKMEYTGKVALVTQVGANELIVRWDSSNKDYKVVKVGSGWQFESDQGFHLDLLVNSGKLSVSNPKAYKPGDVILAVTGYKNDIPVWSGVPVFMHISGGEAPDINLDLSGLTGMLMPDLSALLNGFNFGFYAPSPVEEEKLFDLEGSTLMTVSPQETVSLTITLDEQDIAKVSVGQKAKVKVEALDGEIFEAKVTQVANRGANSGGSSKFTAKLEMPKAKDMLDGMSATAALALDKREAVPTIPVMALGEEGSQTVVYTALDEEGKPANPIPVTIGLSDGLTAEILSGLEVGDTYYYSYYDVLEEDTGVEDRFTLT